MASQVVTAGINRSVNATQNASTVIAYSIPANLNRNYSYTNSNAGGAGVVDQIYSQNLTLAATAVTINLTSFTDIGGNAGNMARVREFYVENVTTTAGYAVKVETGATNGVTWLPAATSPLYANASGTVNGLTAVGAVHISDPVSTGSGNGNVVTTAGCNVKLDPGANTITVNVTIIGTTVA